MVKNRTLAVLFILIALLAFFFAYYTQTYYTGSYVSEETYGGDAYTGIQNAAALTARNVNQNTYIQCQIAGMSFVLVGLILGSIGITSLQDIKKASKTNEE